MRQRAESKRRAASGVWTAAIILAAACAPRVPVHYQRHVDLARHSVEEQDYAAAAEHWARAAHVAETEADRQEALFRRAALLRKTGDENGYWSIIQALADSPGPRQARAAYELARRAFETEPDRGSLELEQVVVRFQSSAHAESALNRLTSVLPLDARNRLLTRLQPLIRDQNLHEYVLILLARNAEQRGDRPRALQLYTQASSRYPYPKGQYWDEAMLRRAVLLAEAGDRAAALQLLTYMLSHQETPLLFGSYTRRYAVARILSARLLLEHDWQGAYDKLLQLASVDEESRLADDAVWAAALLAKEHADVQQACAAASALGTHHPDSRYASCLGFVCPRHQLTQTCRSYVLHQRNKAQPLLDQVLEPLLRVPDDAP